MNQTDPKPDTFCDLTTCADPIEADLVKIELQSHGIEAIIDGSEVHMALGFASPALGSIRILVRESDLESAREIYKAWHRGRDRLLDQPPWFCGPCNVDVEGHFQVCWSCGESRESVEAPFPATASQVVDQNTPTATAALSDPGNPWASPGSQPARSTEGDAVVIDQNPRNITRTLAIASLAIAMLTVLAPVIPVVAILILLQRARKNPVTRQYTRKLSRFDFLLFAVALTASVLGSVYWLVAFAGMGGF